MPLINTLPGMFLLEFVDKDRDPFGGDTDEPAFYAESALPIFCSDAERGVFQGEGRWGMPRENSQPSDGGAGIYVAYPGGKDHPIAGNDLTFHGQNI